MGNRHGFQKRKRKRSCFYSSEDNEQTVSDLLIYDGQGHNRNKSRNFFKKKFISRTWIPRVGLSRGSLVKDSVQPWLALVHDEECSDVLSRPNLSHLSDSIPQG